MPAAPPARLVDQVAETLNEVLHGPVASSAPIITRHDAFEVLDRWPDGWAREGGEWVELPAAHTAHFDGDGWTLEHPLMCRTGGRRLHECAVNAAMAALDPADWVEDGDYEVAVDNGGRPVFTHVAGPSA